MAPSSRSKRPGTMRERSPGHWELRAFAGPDPVTGKPQQVGETFIGTDKQAGKALARLVAKVESGRFNRTTATVGQMLDKSLVPEFQRRACRGSLILL
jgi:hypothetical protein